jgi:hypothetical protein
MRAYLSTRRPTPVVALVLLALAGTGPAALAGDTKFQAAGTFQVVGSRGSHYFIEGEGWASPGGPFTNTVKTQVNNGNSDEKGVMTLDFGKGDTLTIYFEDEWVPDPGPAYPAGGYRVGPYVVVGGTGQLAGVTGSGKLKGIPNGDGTGSFYLDGMISR